MRSSNVDIAALHAGINFDVPTNNSVLLTTAFTFAIFVVALFISKTRPGNEPRRRGSEEPHTGWEVLLKKCRQELKLKNSRGEPFSFQIDQRRFVSASGEDFRDLFLTQKGLSWLGGDLAFSAGSRTYGVGSDPAATEFSPQMFFFRKADIARAVPDLLYDLRQQTAAWGTGEIVDPFEDMFKAAFKIIIRMTTCSELVCNSASVNRLMECYRALEKTAKPLTSTAEPQNSRNVGATESIHRILAHYIDLRRKCLPEGGSTEPLDSLISSGRSNGAIVEIILDVITAGVTHLAINACWILLYIGTNSSWKEEILGELKSLLDQTPPSHSLHERLSLIPLSAWENTLPIADAAIKETVRLTIPDLWIRRNVSVKSIPLAGGMNVQPGDYLVYSQGDVHHNPTLYDRPEEFNPHRQSVDLLKGIVSVGSLGWAGGLEATKLELKLLLACVLSECDYDVVDGSGKLVCKGDLEPNRDDVYRAGPIGGVCYLKIKRKVNVA